MANAQMQGEQDGEEEKVAVAVDEEKEMAVVEEEGETATGAVPTNREELLVAIAECDFGLLTTAESTLATPAIRALKTMCKARGVAVPEAAAKHRLPGGVRAGDPLAAVRSGQWHHNAQAHHVKLARVDERR